MEAFEDGRYLGAGLLMAVIHNIPVTAAMALPPCTLHWDGYAAPFTCIMHGAG